MKKFISDVSLLDLMPFNFKGNEETENIHKYYLHKMYASVIPVDKA